MITYIEDGKEKQAKCGRSLLTSSGTASVGACCYLLACDGSSSILIVCDNDNHTLFGRKRLVYWSIHVYNGEYQVELPLIFRYRGVVVFLLISMGCIC